MHIRIFNFYVMCAHILDILYLFEEDNLDLNLFRLPLCKRVEMTS